jgi:hypothetical protein
MNNKTDPFIIELEMENKVIQNPPAIRSAALKVDPDASAYPVGMYGQQCQPGVTIRTLIAAQAMAAILSRTDFAFEREDAVSAALKQTDYLIMSINEGR